jgi:DNA ligase-1
MNATELQHGIEWDGLMEIDFTGCTVTEKLDGWRALWDGERLLSRQGKDLCAPADFIRHLPAGVPLDGEIYAGAGTNHDTVNGLLRSGKWNMLKFVAFDSPKAVGSHFARMETIPENVEKVRSFPVGNLTDLKTAIITVKSEGGEGVMIREFGGYVSGRNFGIIKAYCDRMDCYQF